VFSVGIDLSINGDVSAVLDYFPESGGVACHLYKAILWRYFFRVQS